MTSRTRVRTHRPKSSLGRRLATQLHARCGYFETRQDHSQATGVPCTHQAHYEPESIDLDILVIVVIVYHFVTFVIIISMYMIMNQVTSVCARAQAASGIQWHSTTDWTASQPNVQAQTAASGHVQVAAKEPATKSPAPAAAASAKIF